MKKKLLATLLLVAILCTCLAPLALAVSDYYATTMACELYTGGSFTATVRATLRSGTCIQRLSATTGWLYGECVSSGFPGYGQRGYVYSNYTTYLGAW